MPFLRINNRNNFLIKEHKTYHPSSYAYIRYWQTHFRRIVEGLWAPDDSGVNWNIDEVVNESKIESKQWRWMPPNLYFYVNFGTILHKPEGSPKTAPKVRMPPYLRDLEWELFYNFIEARGFSGFVDDEEYSCNRDLLDKNLGLDEYDATCYNSNGDLKTYIPARDYLRKLHTKPLGLPIYRNDAKNLMLLGSRELGKSFSVGIGILLHELLTDGRKRYEPGSKLPKAELFCGSGIASKSYDLMQKCEIGMRNLPGEWREGDKIIPSPIYKRMSGSIKPNSIWTHSYEKKVGGRWEKVGSESYIKHGVYTTENPEAAAGGRYTVIVCEEVGLIPNVLTIHGSNSAAQQEGTVKMGSSIYIGTGGNISKVVESEIMFRDPETYNLLSFEDEWEGMGKLGFFVPAYYKDNEFKDENGNTNIEKAVAFYERRRNKLKNAKSSRALDMEMMNYPLKPSEMFLSANQNKFPIADLKVVLSQLLSTKSISDASWKGKLYMDENKSVSFRAEPIKPITDFPIAKNNSDIEGCIEIYEHPVTDGDGDIPSNRYIMSLDPVDDDDNSNISRSLQSTLVLDTFTDRIVAEYTGRTRFVKEYYEQVRRLAMYYSCRILYENQKKGLYQHFLNQNSTYLLIDTPEMLKEMDMQKPGIGNKSKGIYMTSALIEYGISLSVDWLESDAPNKEGSKILHTVRSIGLLRELVAYNGEINTDRVSSLLVLMIYRETLVKHKESIKRAVRTKASDPFFSKHFRKGYTQQQIVKMIKSNFNINT